LYSHDSGEFHGDRRHQPDIPERLIARAALLLSLLCSLILGSMMVFPREPFWMTVHVVFLVAVVLVLRLRGYFVRTAAFTGWMLSLAAINLVVVVPELALRIVDFRYAPGIRGGYQQMAVREGLTRLIPTSSSGKSRRKT
jgi:K+-sensing histidine kinase KdpD